MNRKSILATVGVLAVAGSLAIPAGAGSATRTSSTQKVYTSFMCHARVSKYDPRSWACTTVTVDPWQVNAGEATSLTYVFKAKKTLRYTQVCFSGVSYDGVNCIYKHNFRVLKRGRTIKRTFQVQAPMVQESGNYRIDNLTSFYKRLKGEKKGVPYWETMRSTMCIIAASQPDFQCHG